MNPEKLSIQATIAASQTKTWEYYTEPEHIVNWNFASDDWHCPAASNDVRPGGKMSATMAARDGSLSFEFEGIYEEVTPYKSMTYSMGDGRKVAVLFEPVGESTLVSVTFDPEQTHSLEMQSEGWQSILDNFKDYTESN